MLDYENFRKTVEFFPEQNFNIKQNFNSCQTLDADFYCKKGYTEHLPIMVHRAERDTEWWWIVNLSKSKSIKQLQIYIYKGDDVKCADSKNTLISS